jgi:cyclopropane fatty-acyl-phospholipid synthase-like methyltransferase
MIEEYHQIKDKCRSGLLNYLAEAVSLLPKINKPKVLDIGCGSGVPTLWFAENYGGIITAVDTNMEALEWLKEKVIRRGLENQITVKYISFYDMKQEPCFFDIILAEGFLNIIGFEVGFVKLVGMLKEGGHFIIHDEFKDHETKCEFIKTQKCELTCTLFMDESIWWDHYYRQLEEELLTLNSSQINSLFESEMKEIELFKSDPSLFRSIYYIIKRS